MGRIKPAIDSPHLKGWATRIGQLVLNFSSLEFESIQWLVQLNDGEGDIQKWVQKPFAERIRGLLLTAAKRKLNDSWLEEANKSWGEALEIAKLRNRVAHNPLVFGWSDPDEKGPPDHIGIVGMRITNPDITEVLLSTASIDASVNAIVALFRKLEPLRISWCENRDAEYEAKGWQPGS